MLIALRRCPVTSSRLYGLTSVTEGCFGQVTSLVGRGMPGQTVTLGLVGLAVAPGLGRCAGVPNIGNWVVLGEHIGGICKGCLCLSDASASRGWRPGQAVVRARAGGVHAGAAGISSRGLGGRRGQVQTDLRARARSHCCALAGVAPDCPHALPWSQGLATGYAQQSRLVMGVGPVGVQVRHC